jgi:predicted nuclease of predicted toxin-antitoxin system
VSNARRAAADYEILDWAKANQHIVFTHDLDFGAILAATKADSPSVIQLRTQDILPTASCPLLLRVLDDHRSQLEDGALISVDTRKARVHILPIDKHGR